MIIQPISDTHFECDSDEGQDYIDNLDPTNVNVLIMAGDIFSTNNFNTYLNRISQICKKYPDVIYVPGNHEYWKNSVYRKLNHFDRLKDANSNLHILDDANSTMIGGQRFIGGTMWYKKWESSVPCQFPDFKMIENFDPWYADKNERFEENLEQRLNENDIVITHHMPSDKSVAPQYIGDSWNRFFLNDMEPLIIEMQPRLWVHGHTHEIFDYYIGTTRVLCNPRGYPHERENAKRNPAIPNLKIEV